MITMEEMELLCSAPVREAIERNLGADPIRVALDRSLPHARLVASQVKYLARCAKKLPSFHRARCIIPGLAFEQSTGEGIARGRGFSGRLCIDLTCGLGADALGLAGGFERVIAVERDPVLARVAAENFHRMGVDNIDVVNAAAEEFLGSYRGPRPDLIFADPDRRGAAGQKLYRIEDCSPDVAALWPRMSELADTIAVKLSPLFDVDEAHRMFGPGAAVSVVSEGGECREVTVTVGTATRGEATTHAVVAGHGTVSYPWPLPESGATPPHDAPDSHAYMVAPDVALAKARVARQYFREAGMSIETDDSYAFSRTLPAADVPGRVYAIREAIPYQPKKLKTLLHGEGIGEIMILKKHFPHSTAEIARALGVREGSGPAVAFTACGGGLWAVRVDGV